jgi:hypothetical protein
VIIDFFNAALTAIQNEEKEQDCKKYIFIIGHGGDIDTI